MWNTERGAKVIQVAVLLALGVIASRDVERTMRQAPVSREQTESLQAFLEEHRERGGQR